MKIAFCPMDGHGHVNACIGLAKILKGFENECIFIVPKNWTKTVAGNDFGIEAIEADGFEADRDPQEKWGKFMEQRSRVFDMETVEKFIHLNVPSNESFYDYLIKTDDQYSLILERMKPDLIIFDFWVSVPAIVNSGIPYVTLWSTNPLLAYWSYGAPPYSSAFGINDDPKEFEKLRIAFNESLVEIKSSFDEFYRSKGIDPSKQDRIDFSILGKSPFLNLYPYPEDLDYSEFGPVPEKWFRVDHMVRGTDDIPLGIDESFFTSNANSKIILFSLGSLGTSNYQLMTRLINILGKSPHKFIVSKGIHHEKMQLPGNMTGAKYLNQMKIMPRVDMVIHHGGNNSFIETLYFGKPFIVMPLFGDQHDNGRRAIDKKIGKCFLPYRVTEDELVQGIDEILNDSQLIERVKLIGKHLRETKSHQVLNEKLTEMVNQFKMNNLNMSTNTNTINNQTNSNIINTDSATRTITNGSPSHDKSGNISPVWNEPSIPSES
ncbi:uncharacterized UDP-glucosyltransferase YojK-like [Panonychus citri]|uniref:uncharacterized UDP-glucosyltransferase YojK-like n=1 Tax=Panonychus citri TaxID=50023 RepID=UPI0023083369|nr:uncharacterized UDP-glucosyltransferase YojK-like [Panonychus citri]